MEFVCPVEPVKPYAEAAAAFSCERAHVMNGRHREHYFMSGETGS